MVPSVDNQFHVETYSSPNQDEWMVQTNEGGRKLPDQGATLSVVQFLQANKCKAR